MIYIPFTTGEHKINENNYKDTDFEIRISQFDLGFSGVSLIKDDNEAKNLWEANIKRLTNIIAQGIQHGGFGDDDFFDYLPDYFEQLLYLAAFLHSLDTSYWDKTAKFLKAIYTIYTTLYEDMEQTWEFTIGPDLSYYQKIFGKTQELSL